MHCTTAASLEMSDEPYFFINLVRDGYALNNNTLKNTIRIIGTPIIKDSANDFWLVLPFGIKPENYNIDIFPAILPQFGITECLIQYKYSVNSLPIPSDMGYI